MTERVLDLRDWVDHHGNTLAAHGTRLAVVLLLALVLRALLHRAVNRLVRTAITGGVFQPLKERARPK